MWSVKWSFRKWGYSWQISSNFYGIALTEKNEINLLIPSRWDSSLKNFLFKPIPYIEILTWISRLMSKENIHQYYFTRCIRKLPPSSRQIMGGIYLQSVFRHEKCVNIMARIIPICLQELHDIFWKYLWRVFSMLFQQLYGTRNCPWCPPLKAILKNACSGIQNRPVLYQTEICWYTQNNMILFVALYA